MSPAIVDPLWQAWATAWSSHNMDQMLSLYADDCTYELAPTGDMSHGKEQLRSLGQGYFSEFPDMTIEMITGFVAGDWAGGEWMFKGTQAGSSPDLPAAGRHVVVRGCSILELVDGAIRRCTDYWDNATMLRQLGLLPAAEQALPPLLS